jgi:hypothetical protein
MRPRPTQDRTAGPAFSRVILCHALLLFSFLAAADDDTTTAATTTAAAGGGYHAARVDDGGADLRAVEQIDVRFQPESKQSMAHAIV